MNRVTFKDYSNDLSNFINKHSKTSELVNVLTSPFEDGLYRKQYLFQDGSTFFEVNRTVKTEAQAEACGIVFTVNVDLIEHEYWSTDDSKSKFWYEKV